MSHTDYTTLVLDLSGVLFGYSLKTTVGLSPSQMANVLDSTPWHDYERGTISEEHAYNQVSQAFNIDLETWTQAFEQMMDSMQANLALISAIKELKQIYPALKICCFSNIPAPELDLLKDEIESWGIIDQFVSASDLGQRKPDKSSFYGFLEQTQESATSCIFVDAKLQSVIAAQTLGFKGILFDNTQSLVRKVHNLLGDPVTRASRFLKRNAKNLFWMLSLKQMQPDNYSQLMILQNTGDRNLVVLNNKGYTWNYFQGKSSLAGTSCPDDADTTSLAMTVLNDIPMVDKVLARDRILSNLNPDGLPYCWFSKTRPRFCHVICANVFRFFVINEWQDMLPGVYDFLCQLLETRAYLHGSRYYQSPDWLLYTLSDLLARRPYDPELERMKNLLVNCVQERIGNDGDYLGAAMRVLSAQSLGVKYQKDLEIVLEGQQPDGGWELTCLWGYGDKPVKIGSRGVVTAMAMNAIRRANKISEGGL
ncbi:hypothetical protein F53441_13371 [Fusarium austroafricanum]|uniref:HAD-like protein n=1 Tax=Fusarium austroafricanum TaxID=2364996 RepID=A0A8H4JRV3_9HYPO|nr:hypothetical protein F53441_13371 [Fusarium austroafricanum]